MLVYSCLNPFLFWSGNKYKGLKYCAKYLRIMGERYIGIDFGGSNLRMAEVNPETGEIISGVFKRSLDDVVDNQQLKEIINEFVHAGHWNIGICAAGTVDEEKRIVTLSPNSKIKGEIDFGRDLMKAGHNVVMTNDMKGAVSAAATFGKGKDYENVLVATYSSGYNCAVARKRKVVTTAEFGHLLYETKNEFLCGCGGIGHLETAVSGNGASLRAKAFLRGPNVHTTNKAVFRFALDDLNKKACQEGQKVYSEADIDDNPVSYDRVVDSITAKHVYQAFVAAPGEMPQRQIQEDQMRAIAVSFGMMNSAYNPLDIMVLMGSQTNDWHLLFDPAIKMYQKEKFQLPSLPFPKIVRTELPEIGVQGAVAYLLSQGKD
jgi:predicted NBD/HSP70 family sugar kinase